MSIFKNISSIPFIGSKWKYRNVIFNIINDKYNDLLNDKFLIIDLFGGSGALTIIFKQLFKNSIFVLNDYDEILTDKNGFNKIDNTIKLYNDIINEIKNKIELNKQKIKFDNETKNNIYNILTNYKNDIENNIQLKRMLSSGLTFNGRMLDLEKRHDLFNRIPLTDKSNYYYNFDNINIIHDDFENVINQIPELKTKYDIKNNNIILLLDPPYLNVDMKTSYKINYWTFQKYLNIIKLFYNNYNLIMFEDSKNLLNDIINFCDDMTTVKTNYKLYNISNEKRNNKTQDIMIVKMIIH